MWRKFIHFYYMLLYIWKLSVSIESRIYFDENSCNFIFKPLEINQLQEGTNKKLLINCSCLFVKRNSNSSYFRQILRPSKDILTIYVDTFNKHVATPSLYDYRPIHPEIMGKCENSQWCATLKFDFHDFNYFFVHTNQVGVTEFQIRIKQQKFNMTVKYYELLHHRLFQIKVLRNYRKFHSVFDYCATFIASLTAFSVGCCTELKHLKNNLRHPRAVCLSIICQHFLMPLITLLLTRLLRLPKQLAYGLCAMSSLPGGGLAHLIVVLIHGDRGLSTTISLVNTLLGVVILSLWLLFFGWFFVLVTRIEYIIIWTAPGVVAHAGGLFANKYCPAVAKALLTWFSRPMLLLSAILLITLGVYINHYAFHYIDYQVVTGLCLVIFGGYCVGGLAGLVLYHLSQPQPLSSSCCEGGLSRGGLRGLTMRLSNVRGPSQRQEAIDEAMTQRMKAMAAENAVFNCLLLIPALRDALTAPYGDMAATVPLWGIFFTPAPICLYFVVHKLKLCVTNFIERRRQKQSQHFSIVTSLAKMAEGMSAVSTAPITATPAPPPGSTPTRAKSEPPLQSNHSSKSIKSPVPSHKSLVTTTI